MLFLIFVYILNNVVLSWLYIRNKDTTFHTISYILHTSDSASVLRHNDQKNLFYSDKWAAISFESHLSGLEEQTKALLLELRNFVISLGSNVIEEIRPHRIVYAKSLTFRTFLDMQPRNDSLIISIRKVEPHRLQPIWLRAHKNQKYQTSNCRSIRNNQMIIIMSFVNYSFTI